MKTSTAKIIRSQSGQGVIEYILILILTVLLFGGIIYQFNDAFKKFANNYFMDYISCLLETGELPIIGGSGGGPQPECEYDDFNLADGKQLVRGASGGTATGLDDVDGIGSGGGGGSSSGGSSSGGSSSGGSSKKASDSPASSTSSGRPSRVAVRGGSTRLKSTVKAKKGGSGSGGNTDNEKGDDSKENNTSSQILDVGAGGSRSFRRGGRRRIVLGRRISTDDDDKEREEGSPKGMVSGGTESTRDARITVKPRAPSNQIEEEDDGFSFGWMLKFLIIAGIIIALIIFIGGQAVQINKSM